MFLLFFSFKISTIGQLNFTHEYSYKIYYSSENWMKIAAFLLKAILFISIGVLASAHVFY